MRLNHTVILMLITLILAASGCAVTGPADDGFENSQESIDIGKLDTTGLIGLLMKKNPDSKSLPAENKIQ